MLFGSNGIGRVEPCTACGGIAEKERDRQHEDQRERLS